MLRSFQKSLQIPSLLQWVQVPFRNYRWLKSISYPVSHMLTGKRERERGGAGENGVAGGGGGGGGV